MSMIEFNGNELILQNSGLYKNRLTNEEMLNILGGSSKPDVSTYLKIAPTFINAMKGRIAYRGKTKLTLEKLTYKDPVVLGTIVDLNKIERVLEKKNLTTKDIMDYVKNFDMVPLLYNDNSDLTFISRENKKNIFSVDSKLCFVSFGINNVSSYYTEVPSKEIKIKYEDIDEVIKEKNYVVSHYIFDNYFFLVPVKKLKIKTCELVHFKDDKFEFEKVENLDYVPNGRKITIKEMNLVIKEAKTHLSKFS